MMPSEVFNLSCTKCGSNRLRFPAADNDPVMCEECGTAGKSLRDVKVLIAGGKVATPDSRAEQRDRHFSEVEVSQMGIRDSISETQRLVGEAEKMLRRHRKEVRDEES